ERLIFETVWVIRSAFLLGVTKGVRESWTVTRWLEELGGGVELPLVRVPAGSFLMGSPESEIDRDSDEGPQHRVNFPRDFWVGQFAVTQAQYQAVMGSNPATSSDRDRFVDPNKPVINVSWDDAVAFCEALTQLTGRTYRLLTEAQWEYACRAGTSTPFAFGETITPDLVNYNGKRPYANAPKGEFRRETTVVGSFPANAWGLYDMHGNVWEWCRDPWTGDYTWKKDHPATNDGSIIFPYSNTEERRVLRGGSWFVNARNTRSASQGRFRRDYRNVINGFRVVLQ
ncbi:MAG: formylglycine-generating enzyme family protein, partial [Prochlorothrix sp.]